MESTTLSTICSSSCSGSMLANVLKSSEEVAPFAREIEVTDQTTHFARLPDLEARGTRLGGVVGLRGRPQDVRVDLGLLRG